MNLERAKKKYGYSGFSTSKFRARHGHVYTSHFLFFVPTVMKYEKDGTKLNLGIDGQVHYPAWTLGPTHPDFVIDFAHDDFIYTEDYRKSLADF